MLHDEEDSMPGTLVTSKKKKMKSNFQGHGSTRSDLTSMSKTDYNIGQHIIKSQWLVRKMTTSSWKRKWSLWVELIRKFLEGLNSGQVWSDKWEVVLWRKAWRLILESDKKLDCQPHSLDVDLLQKRVYMRPDSEDLNAGLKRSLFSENLGDVVMFWTEE